MPLNGHKNIILLLLAEVTKTRDKIIQHLVFMKIKYFDEKKKKYNCGTVEMLMAQNLFRKYLVEFCTKLMNSSKLGNMNIMI